MSSRSNQGKDVRTNGSNRHHRTTRAKPFRFPCCDSFPSLAALGSFPLRVPEQPRQGQPSRQGRCGNGSNNHQRNARHQGKEVRNNGHHQGNGQHRRNARQPTKTRTFAPMEATDIGEPQGQRQLSEERTPFRNCDCVLIRRHARGKGYERHQRNAPQRWADRGRRAIYHLSGESQLRFFLCAARALLRPKRAFFGTWIFNLFIINILAKIYLQNDSDFL